MRGGHGSLGGSHASSSHETSLEPTTKRREDLGKHSVYTHFPKDRNCEICKRTKIKRAPCRRRKGEAVPRADNFGDLITGDHKVLSDNCESRNNHRYAVVVQDLATQWIQAYPCKNKTSQETQRSLQKFLEPERKPKVIYTDNSLEFGKACEDLSWNHCTSTPRRSETNIVTDVVLIVIVAVIVVNDDDHHHQIRSETLLCSLKDSTRPKIILNRREPPTTPRTVGPLRMIRANWAAGCSGHIEEFSPLEDLVAG